MKKFAAILTTLTIFCVWTPSAPAHDDEHHRLDSTGVKLKVPAAKPDKKKFVELGENFLRPARKCWCGSVRDV